MKISEVLDKLPNNSGAVVVLSGGMDSTIAMRLAVEKYGNENVRSLTFFYGQKQYWETECAKRSSEKLNVPHTLFGLEFLQIISMGMSANVDSDIPTPTIKDVIGDPQPKTYVPNRNMILASICAAYAERYRLPNIIMGLQVHDEYGYWDTTQKFVDSLNAVLAQNRTFQPTIIAPFSSLSKTEEIELLLEMDGKIDLLKYTCTCYNPQYGWMKDQEGNTKVYSCGKCPSCSERLRAFKNVGIVDPIPYYSAINKK